MNDETYHDINRLFAEIPALTSKQGVELDHIIFHIGANEIAKGSNIIKIWFELETMHIECGDLDLLISKGNVAYSVNGNTHRISAKNSEDLYVTFYKEMTV